MTLAQIREKLEELKLENKRPGFGYCLDLFSSVSDFAYAVTHLSASLAREEELLKVLERVDVNKYDPSYSISLEVVEALTAHKKALEEINA